MSGYPDEWRPGHPRLPKPRVPQSPRKAFSGKRLTWKLLLVLVPVTAICLTVWALITVPPAQRAQALADRSTELVQRLLDADPATLDMLIDQHENPDTYFLTAQTSRAAYGENPEVQTLVDDTQIDERSATATAVTRSTVQTSQGELVVLLRYTKDRDDDDASFKPRPLIFPLLKPTFDTQTDPTPPTELTLYGKSMRMQPKLSNSPDTNYALWPGDTGAGYAETPVLAWTPGNTTYSFQLRLDSAGDQSDHFVASQQRPVVTSRIKTEATRAVTTAIASCPGSGARPPGTCPAAPYTHRGDQLRNVKRAVPRPPTGSELVFGNDAYVIPGTGTGTGTGELHFEDTSSFMTYTGEWFDGKTWRPFEETWPIRAQGTVAASGNISPVTAFAEAQVDVYPGMPVQ